MKFFCYCIVLYFFFPSDLALDTAAPIDPSEITQVVTTITATDNSVSASNLRAASTNKSISSKRPRSASSSRYPVESVAKQSKSEGETALSIPDITKAFVQGFSGMFAELRSDMISTIRDNLPKSSTFQLDSTEEHQSLIVEGADDSRAFSDDPSHELDDIDNFNQSSDCEVDDNDNKESHSPDIGDVDLLSTELDPSHRFHITASDLLDLIEAKPPLCAEDLKDIHHASTFLYYVPPRMTFVVYEEAAMLSIFWKGYERLLPVDQQRVVVGLEDNQLTFRIFYSTNRLREDFIPFLESALSKPAPIESKNTMKDKIKIASALFREAELCKAVSVEMDYHPAKKVKFLSSDSLIPSLLPGLDKQARESGPTVLKKPFVEMLSTNKDLESYFSAPALKMPERIGPLAKFLGKFPVKQAEYEYSLRQKARIDWQTLNFLQFSVSASEFYASSSRRDTSDSVVDLQNVLGYLSNFMSIPLADAEERANQSLIAALKAKYKLIKAIVGQMSPRSVAQKLVEAKLYSPMLWTPSTISEASEELVKEQERPDRKHFCLYDGSYCSRYGVPRSAGDKFPNNASKSDEVLPFHQFRRTTNSRGRGFYNNQKRGSFQPIRKNPQTYQQHKEEKKGQQPSNPKTEFRSFSHSHRGGKKQVYNPKRKPSTNSQ